MNLRTRRRLAREVAKTVFDRGLRGEEAEKAFAADPRISPLDPQTILALIQIALIIWKWWQDHDNDSNAEPVYE